MADNSIINIFFKKKFKSTSLIPTLVDWVVINGPINGLIMDIIEKCSICEVRVVLSLILKSC